MDESPELKETVCACETCQEMCHRPCWPTAPEAAALIAKGFADRLMLNWQEEGIDPATLVLCPADEGREGQKKAPEYMKARASTCTFQTPDGLCELHELGLKPLEGRLASCKSSPHEEVDIRGGVIRDSWRTDEGRKVTASWLEIFQPEWNG